GSHSGFGCAGRMAVRYTPSTMSATYVKSRRCLPWLNTLIGLPSRMFLVNRKSAMSGRPHGPYTVKNRNPVVGRRKRWLYVCAIISLAFLVAAYSVSGWFTPSCFVKGMFVLAPYTELVEAYVRCFTSW